jgi:hypothetical protein
VVVLIGLGVEHDRYLADRYHALTPFPQTYVWTQQLHHERIATIGFLANSQYPFYGRDLTNYVQYVGVQTNGGGYRPPVNCTEWVQQLRRGRYTYVVTASPVNPKSPDVRPWTEGQPGAELLHTEVIFEKLLVSVFRIDAARLTRSC